MDLQRVVIVSTQRTWRGGEEQARQLMLGLRSSGCDVRLLARRGSPFAVRMANERFTVADFGAGARGPRAIWKMRRLLRRWRPDVLHYNDPHALTAAGIASWGLGIPLRVMARRVDFPLSSPRRYLWFADRVICVSRAVAEICRAGGIPAERLQVVYDGVDPQRMAAGSRTAGRAVLQLTDQQQLLLTVAALSDHKGHRFLIQALPDILQQQPNVVAAFAGDGERRDELTGLARSLGLEQQVRFLGFRDDVPDLIRAADLFVMPSRLEGLCSTLMDVMFAGIPIVATTAGGIPEVLVDEDDGAVAWLVPPENPGELAAAVVAALVDSAASAHHVQRARDRAMRHFTSARMVENTIAVYKSAQAQAAKPPSGPKLGRTP